MGIFKGRMTDWQQTIKNFQEWLCLLYQPLRHLVSMGAIGVSVCLGRTTQQFDALLNRSNGQMQGLVDSFGI